MGCVNKANFVSVEVYHVDIILFNKYYGYYKN